MKSLLLRRAFEIVFLYLETKGEEPVSSLLPSSSLLVGFLVLIFLPLDCLGVEDTGGVEGASEALGFLSFVSVSFFSSSEVSVSFPSKASLILSAASSRFFLGDTFFFLDSLPSSFSVPLFLISFLSSVNSSGETSLIVSRLLVLVSGFIAKYI